MYITPSVATIVLSGAQEGYKEKRIHATQPPTARGTLELCKCTEAPLAWLTCALFDDYMF